MVDYLPSQHEALSSNPSRKQQQQKDKWPSVCLLPKLAYFGELLDYL
jgi:hypothetical protein